MFTNYNEQAEEVFILGLVFISSWSALLTYGRGTWGGCVDKSHEQYGEPELVSH